MLKYKVVLKYHPQHFHEIISHFWYYLLSVFFQQEPINVLFHIYNAQIVKHGMAFVVKQSEKICICHRG